MANGRCKRHGGKTPPTPRGLANPNAKYGIYAAHFTDEDKAFLDEVKLGQVDDELRLVRMRLNRTIKARCEWEASRAKGDTGAEAPGETHTVLVEKVEDQGVTKDGDVVDTVKRSFRLPDFDALIDRCLARIESLEKTRKELLKVDPEDPEGTNPEGGGATRDRVTFTGGLAGGDDDELPSPFPAKKPGK